MLLVSWAIVALLAAFALAGVALVVRETLRLRAVRQDAPPSLAARYRGFVGSLDGGTAPLNPPLRVAAEFLAALCGFPGLGWMVSGRIGVGLPLIVIVPAIVWALFPLVVSFTGHVFGRPLAVFAMLPAMAVVSATLLALAEVRAAPG